MYHIRYNIVRRKIESA